MCFYGKVACILAHISMAGLWVIWTVTSLCKHLLLKKLIWYVMTMKCTLFNRPSHYCGNPTFTNGRRLYINFPPPTPTWTIRSYWFSQGVVNIQVIISLHRIMGCPEIILKSLLHPWCRSFKFSSMLICPSTTTSHRNTQIFSAQMVITSSLWGIKQQKLGWLRFKHIYSPTPHS